MTIDRDKGRSPRSVPYLLFALLALLFVSLQIYHTGGQPYTLPEDWSIYWSADHVAHGFQLSRIFTVDYFALDIWTYFFGTAAPVMRYLSTLWTILGFAFLFRLCADFFNTRTAIIAVMLLGTLALAQYLTWQAQPFAGLLMIVSALLLFWSRWMRHPTSKHAALYAAVGIASVYIATFSVFIILAQIIFLLLFVRRDWRRYRQTLALFVVILLFALPRVIGFSQVNFQNGLPFNAWFMPDLLGLPISIFPAEFAQFILLMALAIVATGLANSSWGDAAPRLRWGIRWTMAYPIAILIGFLGLLTLLPNLTIGLLYGIGALPIVALLAARGLTSLPRIVQGIALAASLIFALAIFRNPIPGTPYQTIVEQTLSAPEQSNDKLIVSAPYVWQHLPFLHYASDGRTFHILSDEVPENEALLIPPEHMAYQDEAASQIQLSQFIEQTPEIWLYTEPIDGAWGDAFSAAALGNYDEITSAQRSWYANQPSLYGDLRKFVRIPDEQPNQFVFDDQLFLRSWLLRQSVNVLPCQTITVQSWWSASDTVSKNLSMTLVMVNPDDGLGIANADGAVTGRDSLSLKGEPPHVDERSLQVPCDIQPGEYPLLIGVYQVDGDQIHQLPVTFPDGAPVGRLAYLTTLFVQP